MSGINKLDVARNADKDKETELCQTIIDACEALGNIAQERCDGEYEVYWSKLSGMALSGPTTKSLYHESQNWIQRMRWFFYNLMFRLFGRSSIAPRKTGSSGRQEEYESISKAFIEPNTGREAR